MKAWLVHLRWRREDGCRCVAGVRDLEDGGKLTACERQGKTIHAKVSTPHDFEDDGTSDGNRAGKVALVMDLVWSMLGLRNSRLQSCCG